MLETQFKQLNNKLERLSRRVDAHDLRFDGLDEKVDLIAQKLVEHDQRFEVIMEKLADHDQHFEVAMEKLVDHDQRLANIEENMVTKKDFRELINTVDYSVKQVMNMNGWCSFAKAMEHTP